ncbi:B12-binding domain-containing radical SAM protein [Candidatus Woesearchaeota archaeon]|nr:B12-binding domain-containing radical SAM protein [Candidatus Woesearchaeota archaeon]
MKIALIIPPKIFLTKEYTPPLGFAYIAAVLREEGNEVKIIDCLVEEYDYDNLARIIKKLNSDIYGIACWTDSRFETFRTASLIKKIDPESLVLVGGCHAQFTDVDTLNNFEDIDIIVRGEGEITLTEIARKLKEGGGFEDVAGITYRSPEGEIKINQSRPLISDLNKIPLPARDLLPMHKYHPLQEGTYDKKVTSVMFSRGCPMRCIFCSNSATSHGSYRTREPSKCIEELKILKEKYKFQAFDIWDDTFNINKKWLTEICKGIIEEKLDITWYARARLNFVDYESIKLMKRAGCDSLCFGIESGSPRVLEVIKKEITVDMVKEGIKKCLDTGIAVKAGFIFNHPTETLSDVKMTLDLMAYLRKLTYKHNQKLKTTPGILRIYPGTEVEQIARKNGILPKNFSWSKPYYNFDNLRWDSSPYTPLYSGIPLEKLAKFYIKESLKQGEWFPSMQLMYYDLKTFLKKPSVHIARSILDKTGSTALRLNPKNYPLIAKEAGAFMRRKMRKD